MATTRTAKLGLLYPDARSDRDWHQPLMAQPAAIEALSPVSGLCVTASAIGAAPGYAPSGLNVRVSAGRFLSLDGSSISYAGTASQAVTASATTRVWLTAAGALATGAAWPTPPHVRLATVVAGGTDITSIADERTSGHLEGCFVSDYSAAATLTAADSTVLCDATAGAFTVTLPPTSGCGGHIYRIKKVDSSGNAVTVDGDGAETIDGATTTVLSAQWDKITIVSNGFAWFKF